MPDELPPNQGSEEVPINPDGNPIGEQGNVTELTPLNAGPVPVEETPSGSSVSIPVQSERPDTNGEPISEHFAEKNKDLGEEAIKIAKRQEELEDRSPAKVANPFYWLDRRFWKKEQKRNNRSYEELKQEVEGYIGEIQGEANNIAAAFSEYEQAQTTLSHKLGAEPVEQGVDQFIHELDSLTGVRQSRYSQGERPQITEEQYRQAGKVLAVADFLTPHLPIEHVPEAHGPFLSRTSYVRDFPTASGAKTFETYGNGHRLPRLEVTVDKQQAQEMVKQTGSDHVLEINVRTSSVGGASKPEATKRYIVLDEETYDVLKDTASSLEGVVGLGNESNMYGTFRGPWSFIDYSAKVVSKEQLNEPESKIRLSYRTSDGHFHDSEIVGTESDVREQAFAEVVGQEWGPSSGLNTVSGATVELPDGETVQWQAYVQPFVEASRAEAA
jgi:hypothetical protein